MAAPPASLALAPPALKPRTAISKASVAKKLGVAASSSRVTMMATSKILPVRHELTAVHSNQLWSFSQQQRQQGNQQARQLQAAQLRGDLQIEQLVTLETNIDDMSPQLLAYTVEKLTEAGALDVWMVNAVMKKGRPGVVLHVLCAEAVVNNMLTVIFFETTTLGVRIRPCDRVSVQRVVESAMTPWGWVPVKAAFANGQLVTATAEYEDCAAIARSHSVPLKLVKAAAEAAYMENEAREQRALQADT